MRRKCGYQNLNRLSLKKDSTKDYELQRLSIKLGNGHNLTYFSRKAKIQRKVVRKSSGGRFQSNLLCTHFYLQKTILTEDLLRRRLSSE